MKIDPRNRASQIRRIQGVESSADRKHEEPSPAVVRTSEQPAVELSIGLRCPVCESPCSGGDQANPRPRCPAAEAEPALHERLARIRSRVRTERNRALAEILRRQAATLAGELRAAVS